VVLPPPGNFATGIFFMAAEASAASKARFAQIAEESGLKVLSSPHFLLLFSAPCFSSIHLTFPHLSVARFLALALEPEPEPADVS
jgi:hypothetical protein